MLVLIVLFISYLKCMRYIWIIISIWLIGIIMLWRPLLLVRLLISLRIASVSIPWLLIWIRLCCMSGKIAIGYHSSWDHSLRNFWKEWVITLKLWCLPLPFPPTRRISSRVFPIYLIDCFGTIPLGWSLDM